jgi:hypothetical protein
VFPVLFYPSSSFSKNHSSLHLQFVVDTSFFLFFGSSYFFGSSSFFSMSFIVPSLFFLFIYHTYNNREAPPSHRRSPNLPNSSCAIQVVDQLSPWKRKSTAILELLSAPLVRLYTEKFIFANEKDRRAQLNPSDNFNNMPTSINSETPGIVEAERTALLEMLTQPIVRLFTDRKRQNSFFSMNGDHVQRAMDNIVKSDKAKESMGEGEEVDAEAFESLQRQMNDYSAAAPAGRVACRSWALTWRT